MLAVDRESLDAPKVGSATLDLVHEEMANAARRIAGLSVVVPAPALPVDRRFSRVEMQTEVELSSGGALQTGISVNLSEGGLFVALRKQPALGSELRLSFTLPDGPVVKARGFVRWCRDLFGATPRLFPGVGIEFYDMSVDSRRAIHEFIASHEPAAK